MNGKNVLLHLLVWLGGLKSYHIKGIYQGHPELFGDAWDRCTFGTLEYFAFQQQVQHAAH